MSFQAVHPLALTGGGAHEHPFLAKLGLRRPVLRLRSSCKTSEGALYQVEAGSQEQEPQPALQQRDEVAPRLQASWAAEDHRSRDEPGREAARSSTHTRTHMLCWRARPSRATLPTGHRGQWK
eukprot:11221996-Lingulodinium_polyedra.AAC.1